MKTKILIAITLVVTALAAFAFTTNSTQKTENTTMKNELDSVSYSLGVSIAKNLQNQGMDKISNKSFSEAINDVYSEKDLAIDEKQAEALINAYFKKLQEIKAEKLKKAGQDFLANNKNKEGVVELPSGLQYKIIKEGTGDKPGLSDNVTTHYHGTFIDGKVFDSSKERNQPASFPVSGVIKGWTEALQMMPVGSVWELYIPYDLAYGAGGRGGIPPYSTLVFEVELISINAQ